MFLCEQYEITLVIHIYIIRVCVNDSVYEINVLIVFIIFLIF